MFYVFFKTKKKKKKPNVFSVFSLFFQNKKLFSKTVTNQALMSSLLCLLIDFWTGFCELYAVFFLSLSLIFNVGNLPIFPIPILQNTKKKKKTNF